MRIGFITCVRLGESCLEELAALGADLVYLGTIHDGIARNKSGRIYLDDFADAHHVPLHKFRNMNDPDALEVIEASDLDWLYVIGWSQMAKAEVLSIPKRGVVGIHPTLLPQGRGRASIPWAIIKDLDETGVTMFKLDDGMDTGPILGQVVVPVEADETAATLYEKVVEAALADKQPQAHCAALTYALNDLRAALASRDEAVIAKAIVKETEYCKSCAHCQAMHRKYSTTATEGADKSQEKPI